MIANYSFTRLLAEIAKCSLICAKRNALPMTPIYENASKRSWMTTTLPGAAAADSAPAPMPFLNKLQSVLASNCDARPIPHQFRSTRQSLPMRYRQTLPGRLKGTHVAKLVCGQAIDSNEQNAPEGSALTKILFGPANATVSA